MCETGQSETDMAGSAMSVNHQIAKIFMPRVFGRDYEIN
jgi:hypothetical protein